MKDKFTAEKGFFALILSLLLISIGRCAILPQNLALPKITTDFTIPQFPDINFLTPLVPELLSVPIVKIDPIVSKIEVPIIPDLAIPKIPPIQIATPAIPINPCELKPFCGLAANFKTQAQLKSFVDKNCPNYWFYPMYFARADANTVNAPTAAPSTPSASTDFSGTNNQQSGVDEADILKTDGQFIYSVSNQVLSIIKAYPTSQTKIVSTITLKGNAGSLFLDGNYLAIFGTDYQEIPNPNPNPPVNPVDPVDPVPLDQTLTDASVSAKSQSFARPYYHQTIVIPFTWVYIYDISKKASPKLIKNYTIAGYYSNGRKSEETGFVYLLSNQDCRSSYSSIPWYNFGSGRKNMTLSQIFYYPVSQYNSVTFTNLFTFNLRNPQGRDENVISFLTLSSWVIYMSQKFLYLTSVEWIGSSTETKIHKVYVYRSRLIPMADGSVPGSVQKQFWLDEYNYDLRIATTETNSQGVPSNNVFCLDFSLKIIGSVRKIAPNETIFSARYVDNRLYLITFRRIDPFFVIDLTNHRLPKVLGELKITGFSNYLHPYDSETIIGFGQETNDQGQQIGLKVSLFDVTDVQSPRSVADYVLPLQYSYSNAQWEHKAFLFSKEKNLMVIPASFYNWIGNTNGPNSFNGAMVFDIRRDSSGASIQLRAIVNHLLESEDEFWKRSVQRSFYIENMLYTKSNCLLRVHKLQRLDRVLNLNLNCQYNTESPIAAPALPVFDPPAPLQISGSIPVV